MSDIEKKWLVQATLLAFILNRDCGWNLDEIEDLPLDSIQDILREREIECFDVISGGFVKMVQMIPFVIANYK